MAEEPTDIQARVASALPVKIAGDSRRVAAGRLHDAVAGAIGSEGSRIAEHKGRSIIWAAVSERRH